MKFFGLILFILLATVLLGEAVLIFGYFTMAISAWFCFRSRWISGLIAGLCLIAVFLHANGFKLYGKPALIDEKESLAHPRRVIALEPPSKVVFVDGSILLTNVFFPKSVNLLQNTSNQNEFWDGSALYTELRDNSHQYQGIDVELKNPTNSSDAICLRRALYWCGNTWFPHFFPKGLPRMLRENFGAVLVRAGIALPTVEYVEKAPQHQDPLMSALDRGYFQSIPPHHSEIIKLGRYLIENRPDNFGIGVELLIRAEDFEMFSKLAEEIRKRRPNSSTNIADIDWQLIALDKKEAEKAMRNLEAQPRPDPLNAAQVAGTLAQQGDWSGFDFLTKLFTQPELELDYRKSLGTQLTIRFGFTLGSVIGWGTPEKVSELFPEWYAENRNRLRWLKQPDGRTGFALTNGTVLDEAYYKTMESYQARFQSAQQ